jgi:hypothetical protein
MKGSNLQRFTENNNLIAALEGPGLEREIDGKKVILRKEKENPPLGPKYLLNAPFKFGGKKRSNSNSGGCGRAGRRQRRHGKGK